MVQVPGRSNWWVSVAREHLFDFIFAAVSCFLMFSHVLPCFYLRIFSRFGVLTWSSGGLIFTRIDGSKSLRRSSDSQVFWTWLWKYMKIRKTLWTYIRKTNIQPTQKCQENVPRITGWKRHSDAFTCLLIINECDGKVQQAFSLALGQIQNANQNFVVFTHWKEHLFHKAFHFLCWAFNFNPRRTSKNIETSKHMMRMLPVRQRSLAIAAFTQEAVPVMLLGT